MGSFNKLKNILEERDNFLLICHVSPDGDAVGSLVAMSKLLRHYGKKFQMVSKDSIPLVFHFIAEKEKITDDFLTGSFDTIILLDNGDLRRTGFPERIKKAKSKKIKIINIDHHPKNDIWPLADINYVDTDSSSACELLYDFFVGIGFDITSSLATTLLSGIYNDTGGFQHSNTSEKTFTVIANLLSLGAQLKTISSNIVHNKPISSLKLWGIAMSRLKINQNFDCAYSVLTAKDIEEAGASIDEVSGLVNLLNTTAESRVTLLLYETFDGKIRGSLRTEDDKIDLSKMASLFGGGGHKKAAGFSMGGRIQLNESGHWKVS